MIQTKAYTREDFLFAKEIAAQKGLSWNEYQNHDNFLKTVLNANVPVTIYVLDVNKYLYGAEVNNIFVWTIGTERYERFLRSKGIEVIWDQQYREEPMSQVASVRVFKAKGNIYEDKYLILKGGSAYTYNPVTGKKYSLGRVTNSILDYAERKMVEITNPVMRRRLASVIRTKTLKRKGTSYRKADFGIDFGDRGRFWVGRWKLYEFSPNSVIVEARGWFKNYDSAASFTALVTITFSNPKEVFDYFVTEENFSLEEAISKFMYEFDYDINGGGYRIDWTYITTYADIWKVRTDFKNYLGYIPQEVMCADEEFAEVAMEHLGYEVSIDEKIKELKEYGKTDAFTDESFDWDDFAYVASENKCLFEPSAMKVFAEMVNKELEAKAKEVFGVDLEYWEGKNLYVLPQTEEPNKRCNPKTSTLRLVSKGSLRRLSNANSSCGSLLFYLDMEVLKRVRYLGNGKFTWKNQDTKRLKMLTFSGKFARNLDEWKDTLRNVFSVISSEKLQVDWEVTNVYEEYGEAEIKVIVELDPIYNEIDIIEKALEIAQNVPNLKEGATQLCDFVRNYYNHEVEDYMIERITKDIYQTIKKAVKLLNAIAATSSVEAWVKYTLNE